MPRLLPAHLLGLAAALSSFALTADLVAQQPPPPPGPVQPPPPVLLPLPPPGAAQPPSPGAAQPPPGYGQPPPGYYPPGYYPPPGYYAAYGYPSPSEAPPVPMERRSTGVWVTGLVLTVLGGSSLVLGSLAFASTPETDCGPCIDDGACPPCSSEDSETGPIAAMVIGVVGLGAGIPMIIWGGKKVPAKPAEPAEPSAALVIGPGHLSLKGRF